MLKIVLIFLLKLFLISIIDGQKYLECKFDAGELPCRLVPTGTSPELEIISSITTDDLLVDPVMPLSDVTSIMMKTEGNGLPCSIPYRFDGSSKDIYFCSTLTDASNVSSCITTDATKQECMLGRYVMSQLTSEENQTYYIEIIGATSPSCLSFYYYITRPNAGQISIRNTDIVGTIDEQIGIVSKVLYNGWHRIEYTFTPHENNYHIHFDLERLENSTALIVIALDEIEIIDGRCKSDIIESTTNVIQTTEVETQQTFITTTTTMTVSSTEETMLSSIQSSSPLISSTTTSVALPSQATFDSTISSTITISTTTQRTFDPHYQCDFTTACFGDTQLDRTNGTQFNPSSLSSSSEPPPAPTSDVASINKPANNDAFCELPYRRALDGTDSSTNWDMWFCYNNQCPTNSSGQTATCTSDSYGLISIAPTETSKTVIDWVKRSPVPRDAAGDQCLRFYYYFTVYDAQDWGQQMEVWIRPNNETTNRVLIKTLAINDMKNNRWEFAEIPFDDKSADSYTLEFKCVVSAENRPGSHATNRTIYFALDDIAVYDYNCSYVNERVPAVTRPIVTTIPPTKDRGNLGLLLGLSLGIGGGLVVIVIVFLIYKSKGKGRSRKQNDTQYDKYFPLESPIHKRNQD